PRNRGHSARPTMSGSQSALRHSLSEGASMQLCYRNDAASDIDEDGDEDLIGPDGGRQSEWQKFRRPPKSLQICPLGSLSLKQIKTEKEVCPIFNAKGCV
uniref:Potassium voltage-gated channel, KQT-like subfamily, member 5a n=1 Tax=Macrostomum lignano TaxID=282301 RepID=A0A1I8GJW4_9PLAT